MLRKLSRPSSEVPDPLWMVTERSTSLPRCHRMMGAIATIFDLGLSSVQFCSGLLARPPLRSRISFLTHAALSLVSAKPSFHWVSAFLRTRHDGVLISRALQGSGPGLLVAPGDATLAQGTEQDKRNELLMFSSPLLQRAVAVKL